mgnify:CR=1 FL=1
MTKRKYYVVWKGIKPGVYDSWNDCKKQIDGFKGAEYKSFLKLNDANEAFKSNYNSYKGTDTKKAILSKEELIRIGKPILDSISVDAACSGNPGKMEYQGVDTHSKKVIFKKGPFDHSSNNIGEFLALVHAIAMMKKIGDKRPIYSDSRTAMSWVRKKKCNSKIESNDKNEDSFDLIKRAEIWLKENTFENQILKWETKAWGEIPADFGRK